MTPLMPLFLIKEIIKFRFVNNFLEKLILHLAPAPSPSRSRSALGRKLKKHFRSDLPALVGLIRALALLLFINVSKEVLRKWTNLMTNLYLVRHAHSTYTPDEVGRPLSAEGVIDTERVSRILENENIDLVISSPYKRAIQTVEGIAMGIGKEIVIEKSFKERMLTSAPALDFNLAITKAWKNPAFSWPGGESNIEAQKRGIAAVENVLETYEGKNIVIGTHGNLMVLMMNYFDKRYDYNFWKKLDMPDIYKLTFEDKNLIKINRIWNRIQGDKHDIDLLS